MHPKFAPIPAQPAPGDIVIWIRRHLVSVEEVSAEGPPRPLGLFSSPERAIEVARETADTCGVTLWVIHGSRWEAARIDCSLPAESKAKSSPRVC
ncbi:MAG: hypothetical protein HY654_01490 [Acidobacteria bacterium]|nr:hypothetical protein [Acidobacteriota bacterium]